MISTQRLMRCGGLACPPPEAGGGLRLCKVKDMISFADFSGNRIELVVRPLNSGWRYFPSRDAGISGLADVICAPDIEKDLSIWSRCSRRAN
jgi:2,3-dihydroxy-p-cumate/2,3-dihydroxybenzoate 3,4-dioxygenase